MNRQAVNLGLLLLALVLLLVFWPFIRKTISSIVDAILKPQQESYIKDLHPKVRQQFRDLIKDIEKRTGYGVYVTSGYRTWAEQAELKKQNASNASAGYSPHNYGLGLDFNLFRGTHWIRKASPASEWIKTGAVAIIKEHGFRWGGDFSTYYDPVHIDLANMYNISQLRAQAIAQYGSNPANVEGNKVTLT